MDSHHFRSSNLPTITAVVCTYNRANLVVRALESLTEQTLDKALYEIILVDNGSTDDTAQVVRRFQVGPPDHAIVYVHEALLGLGHARNAGLNHARGEYVAFLDDDAQASKDWLEHALHCFQQVQPTPLVIGGPIVPWYESPKPHWFKDEYEVRSWGDQPRFLKPGESFSGSNMIFRKSVFETYGRFDTKAGVRGNRLSLGEETSVFDRIWRIRGDERILYYSPKLLVFHSTPSYKMTISYRLKRAFAAGQVWSLRHEPESLAGRLKTILRLTILVIKYIARAFAHRPEYKGYQNWMIERFSPVAVEVGRLAGQFGIHVPLRQR